MPKDIEARVQKAIEGRAFPGCVVGIIRANGLREVWPFRNLTYDTGAPAVREDTVYDLASITKSIPTASIALMLMAEGKLALTDKVSVYIPELKNHHDATIKDLLTYTVQGVKMSELKDKSTDEIRQYIFEHGFDGPRGTSQYTNLPAFLLGLIIERVAGDTLDRLARKHFFGPLGMRYTSFFPDERLRESFIAPTEIVGGEEIRGIVHDESARVFARARKTVGHAGLFSTAPDILNFFEALLRGNEGFTKSIITGAERGLGWQLNEPRWMGKYAGPHTFGKTGFTGTSIVADCKRGVAFVVLSNRTYPRRPTDGKEIDAFRRDIADIVLK